MTRRYRYATIVGLTEDDGREVEFEVEVTYRVAWGSPPRLSGPPGKCHPGAPDEVEDIQVDTIEAKPRPWTAGPEYASDDEMAKYVVEALDDLHDAMLTAAREQEHDDAVRAQEDRAERARENRS